MNYIPLHVHSHYSLLDGLSTPSRITKRIVDIESDGCALTDHGNVSGTIQFLFKMKEAGKKPVLGCELYICDDHATSQTPENRGLTHLPVLAKNDKGWKQLLQIIAKSNDPKHFYHKPRLSLEQLAVHLDGNIIGFSGHLGSHVANAIEKFGKKGGIQTAKALQSVFGEKNFFLEVQLMDAANTPKQRDIATVVREIAELLNIPLIATPDAHYAYKEDAIDQRILLCSNMHVTMKQGQDPNFMLNTFFKSDNFHIPSHQEMLDYGHTEEELANTNKILDMVEEYDEILHKPLLREFDTPHERTPDEHLRQLCRDGWEAKIQNIVPKDKQDEYVKRVEYELGILQGAGLSSYFLIVIDIINYVKRMGWLPGPGRGSAAGCLVSYLIGITEIDPIKYNLIFERFYNSGRNTAERISMPDIDIDVPVCHREEVINYMKTKYGHEYVSQMITYQTMMGARAIKEVLRAYGEVSAEDMNRITKNIPDKAKIADELQQMKESRGESSVLQWCLENRAAKFREWCFLDEDGNLDGPLASQFAQAIRLEGTKASQSRHAAGVVIAPKPLSEICPMIYDTKHKEFVAGWEMEDMESVGILKFDILGIAMLDKVSYVQNLLERRGCDEFKARFDDLNFNCKETWDLLSSGRTKGVFQLESRLGQKLSKELKPENMEHLSALGAIMRPGALESVHEDGTNVTLAYIQKKNGAAKQEEIPPALNDILSPTYGEMIYQEQAMQSAQSVAGFDLQQADVLRKAIGKKKPEVMAQVKIDFLKGAKETNVMSDKATNAIFDSIEKSQRYSFNKSHAMSYAHNAYLSAYCKAHYPEEFFTSYLYFSYEKQKPQQEIYELVNDAKSFNIFVMPPDLNLLNVHFDIIGNKIHFGLSDIKNIGQAAIKKLIALIHKLEQEIGLKKEEWQWLHFLLFASNKINSKVVTSLINSGALDNYKVSRKSMVFEYKLYSEFSTREQNWMINNITIDEKTTLKSIITKMVETTAGRDGAFANKNRTKKGQDLIISLANPPTDLDDKPHQISKMENQLLGVTLTSTELDECENKFKSNCSCHEFNNGFTSNNSVLVIAAQIDEISTTKTKRGTNPGSEMAFVKASDDTGTINSVVVFPEQWLRCKEHLIEGNRLLLSGSRSKTQDSFILESVEQL